MRSDNHLQTVSVIGAGAIGSAAAQVFLSAGLDVTVWNRTPGRAQPLVDEGATFARTLGEAAAADVIVLTLTDGAAVVEVLAELPADLAGRVVVALGTVTPHDARDAARIVELAGGAYLGIGLQHAPEQIGTAAVTLPVGGAVEAIEAARPALELLGTVRHVGGAPSAAAVWDLALFGLWYDAQLGLLRALEAGRAAGIDLTELAAAAQVQLQHVVDAAKGTAVEVDAVDHPPGPADLGQHAPVLDGLIGLRDGSTLGDGGLEQVRRLLRQRIEEGRGAEGLSALVA